MNGSVGESLKPAPDGRLACAVQSREDMDVGAGMETANRAPNQIGFLRSDDAGEPVLLERTGRPLPVEPEEQRKRGLDPEYREALESQAQFPVLFSTARDRAVRSAALATYSLKLS